MYKKYKFKKRKKTINPYYVFAVLAVFLFFLSYSYAFFTDYMSITGKANILDQSKPDITYGNSTYTWEITNQWFNNDTSTYVYALVIPITNLDEDYSSWEIQFDIPQEATLKATEIWQASEISINNNTVSLKSYSWSGNIPYGNTFELQAHLSFDAELDIKINNLILNGKYAKCIKDTTPDNPIQNEISNSTVENTTTNEITNSIPENTVTNDISNSTVENTTTNEIVPDPIIPTNPGTYSFAQTGQWENNSVYTYAISIPINYTGENISSWTISFDVPDGFVLDSSYIWQASSVSYSGNTITLTSHSWNGTLNTNSSITIDTQLSFDKETNISISNLKINGNSLEYSP